MVGEITRREALSALAAGSVAVLAGCSQPAADDRQDSIDLDELENILEIPTKTTHAISSNSEETYDSILWEQDGTLELADGAAVELTAIDT